jgi:hypothetical protein
MKTFAGMISTVEKLLKPYGFTVDSAFHEYGHCNSKQGDAFKITVAYKPDAIQKDSVTDSNDDPIKSALLNSLAKMEADPTEAIIFATGLSPRQIGHLKAIAEAMQTGKGSVRFSWTNLATDTPDKSGEIISGDSPL